MTGEGRRWGGCFGAQSTSPSPTRKAVLGWLVWAGYRKKSRFLRYCKQACISSFRLFFCAFHARDHAWRDRPAVIVGWLRLRGCAVFPVGKTSVTNAQANTAPGLRSKLKKGLETERELAHRSDSKPPFSIRLPRLKCGQLTCLTGFFVTFFDSKKITFSSSSPSSYIQSS